MAAADSAVSAINAVGLRKPSEYEKVFNDECVYSFATPLSKHGLFVNLTTFQGFAKEFVEADSKRSGNVVYLNIKHEKVEKTEDDEDELNKNVTKMAIGVEGGFQFEKFEIKKEYFLFVLPAWDCVPFPSENLKAEVVAAVSAVVDHAGSKAPDSSLVGWEEEIKECEYAKTLWQVEHVETTIKISPNPKDWKCQKSGATENLWLNLSTGYIGDGRQNWDGTGGHDGAMDHFKEMEKQGKFCPLVVKLGTITPNGADVYDYSQDCPVKDPFLADHLAHLGIDIMKQEKTVKTTAELNIELNMNYDWSAIVGDDGEKKIGAGFVGLKNLGNTCYMNSALQAMFSLDEVKQKYLDNWDKIQSSAPARGIADDFPMQMAKLAKGLLTDTEIADDCAAVPPVMFRKLVTKNKREFASSQQQDCQEFLEYLLEFLTQEEKKHAARLGPVTTEHLFKFQVEERFECKESKQVRYQDAEDLMLKLKVDLAKATNLADVEEQREVKRQKMEAESKKPEKEEEKIIPNVPFEACLEGSLSEDLDLWYSPVSLKKSGAMKTTRMKTFPKYLLLQVARYYYDEKYTPQKMEVVVNVPEKLNLEKYKAKGLQEDEKELSKPEKKPGFVADPLIISGVTSMGFTENAAIRACKAIGNANVEQAVNWVMSHIADPDLNDPVLEDKEESSVDPAKVQQIAMMGFTPQQAAVALEKNNHSVERAMGWVFDQQNLEAAVAAHLKEKVEDTKGPAFSNGPSQYELKAIISHLGKSTFSGHYVCHLKKDGDWFLFNDAKVSTCPQPPVGFGYLYLYERME